jgi:5-methylcytosine-specific restriction enzyme subunit McrC
MIPIANLYYLLCYAWDVLPPRGLAPSKAELLPTGHQPALLLLAHLLTTGLAEQRRRGVPVAFAEVETLDAHPRGLLLPARLARLPQAAARQFMPSRHHEITLDTPLNRVVVTALQQLLAIEKEAADTEALPRRLRRAVLGALAPLNRVTPLRHPHPADFRAAALGLRSSDTTAHLLLRAAELLLLNLLPASAAFAATDSPARPRRFHDFTADEVQMGRIFEAFVRNFFRREQQRYAVTSEVLRWRGATATAANAMPLLPVMRTDVTLSNPTRRLVIDTKYYRRPLAGSQYADARLLAPHLYQLLAYLRNQPAEPAQTIEGMLLYPAGTESGTLALEYQLEGFRVHVRTLDLSQSWVQIRQDLLHLIAD